MAITRIPIEAVADQKHGTITLEGNSDDRLPSDRVYVDPQSGAVKDGRLGQKLSALRGGEVEIPRTTWYRS